MKMDPITLPSLPEGKAYVVVTMHCGKAVFVVAIPDLLIFVEDIAHGAGIAKVDVSIDIYADPSCLPPAALGPAVAAMN